MQGSECFAVSSEISLHFQLAAAPCTIRLNRKIVGANMSYIPAPDRYSRMIYRRCGASGLKLPAISLGLWHNFGNDTPHDKKTAIDHPTVY